MQPASSMFSYDITVNKRSILFIAASSLGIPLALYSKKKDSVWTALRKKNERRSSFKSFESDGQDSGWTALRKELEKRFSFKPFKLIDIEHHPETFFPLGVPLSIKASHFFDIFNLQQFLTEKALLPTNYELDHTIWICPSGIVLIIGKISIDDEISIDLTELNETVFENHYPELGYFFNEIAEIIMTSLPEDFLKPPLCCKNDINRIKEGVSLRKQANLHASSALTVTEWLSQDKQAQQLYTDSILDVYFMDYNPGGDLESSNGSLKNYQCPLQLDHVHHQIKGNTESLFQVEYFQSIIVSPDPVYLLMICISYSSFIGLVWLVKHLGEQVKDLQTNLVGVPQLRSDTSSVLKLLRIFCLRFISESNPISIRLKAIYMKCLEDCWEPYRMRKLIDQVNEQLTSLEKIADWIDDNNNAIRDRKISLAAVTLAVVSITAVAAQLVSTIDVGSELGRTERIYFILFGLLVGGILSLIVMFLSPFSGSKPKGKTGK